MLVLKALNRATVLRPSSPIGSQETHRCARPIGRYPAGSSDFPGLIGPLLVMAVNYNAIYGMICPFILVKAHNWPITGSQLWLIGWIGKNLSRSRNHGSIYCSKYSVRHLMGNVGKTLCPIYRIDAFSFWGTSTSTVNFPFKDWWSSRIWFGRS